MIKHEIRLLHSTYLNGASMYPGRQLLTWVKASPFMPWVLMSIEPMPQEGFAK